MSQITVVQLRCVREVGDKTKELKKSEFSLTH